jgi:hypothetical protein
MGIALGARGTSEIDFWLTAALVRNAALGDPRAARFYGPYGPSQVQSLMGDQTARGEEARRLIDALEKGNSPVTQSRRSDWLISLPRPNERMPQFKF